MIIISAFRDFADGLTRGLSLFFTERNNIAADTLSRRSRERGATSAR